MSTREKVLDPTGDSERAVNTTLSPRPGSLRGLTVGLLDNTKANAAVLLDEIGRVLQREHGVRAAVTFTKSYFGAPVEESVIQQILHNCDFVVAGIGDWGSCSAASLADGIVLERAGVPAVSICTDVFRVTAEAMAQVHGFPGYQFVTVPHPIASLSADQLRASAEGAVPGVLRILGVEGVAEGSGHTA